MNDLSELQSEARKLAKQVNQQILRLERVAKGETIAIMHLRNKLDSKIVQGWTKSGRVRFNTKMNDDQLNAIITAIEQFKEEKTGSVKGLKQALERTRQETGENDFTYQDMFDYVVVTTDLEGWITQHMKASKYYHIAHWCEKQQKSKSEFVDIMIKASEDLTNDEDTVKKIKRLYDEYIVKK